MAKKKKSTNSEKDKKPSEKSLLKEEVAELETELEIVDKNFEQQKKMMEFWKKRCCQVSESKVACVRHLRRVLEEKTDDCVEVQDKLQLVKDMTELVGNRASQLSLKIEGTREVERSTFQKQQGELEEQLARLDDRRLQQNSQLAHLKRLEETLEDKLTTENSQTRDESMSLIRDLLQRREEFKSLVDELSKKHKEVYELSIPAFAKRQLNENIENRNDCQNVAESLLSVQGKNRQLNQQQQTLRIADETQAMGEDKDAEKKSQIDDRYYSVSKETDSVGIKKFATEYMDFEILKTQIGVVLEKKARVEDELRNFKLIVEDQEKYMSSLMDVFTKKIERNGLMASTILRAAEIVKSRTTEMRESKAVDGDMDFDLMQQIRMILEIEEAL